METYREDTEKYKHAFFIAGHSSIKPQSSWTLADGLSKPGLMTCACDGLAIFDDMEVVSNKIAKDLQGAKNVTFFELGSGGLLGTYTVVSRILQLVPSIEVVRLILSDAGYVQDYYGKYLIKGDPVKYEDVCVMPMLGEEKKFVFEKWTPSDDPLRIPFQPIGHTIDTESFLSFPGQDCFISEFVQRLKLKIPPNVSQFEVDLVGKVTPPHPFHKRQKDALVKYIHPPPNGHFVYFTVHMEHFQVRMIHRLLKKRISLCSSHHAMDKTARLLTPLAFIIPPTVTALYFMKEHIKSTLGVS